MIWKPVLGYEGIYEVSEYGFVRSLDRIEKQPEKVRNGSKIESFYRKREGKNIKTKTFKGTGRVIVELNKDGAINVGVHRLVHEAFIGPIKKGNIVHHIDCDKKNNHYTNLQQMDFFEHNNIHKTPIWNKGFPTPTETKEKIKRIKKGNYLKRCRYTNKLKERGLSQKEISEKIGRGLTAVYYRTRDWAKYKLEGQMP